MAVAQLEQIPLQQIPAVAPNLPAGSTLPLHHNKHFVGRDAEFRQLAHIAKRGGQAAVFAQAGLTGAGGIGKTQLAVEFAHRYAPYFAGGVFWLNCADPALLSTEMANCAQNKWVDIPYANEVKQEEWVKRLKSFWGSGWPCLVVLDNCEDEKIVTEVAPTSGRVCLLITSRKSNWHAYSRNIHAIPLEVLARPDSQQLLQGLAPHLSLEEAGQIAEQLGDFPLALELAGHYLSSFHQAGFVLPVATYLAELKQAKINHVSLMGAKGVRSLTNHEMDVYATFSLSYEQLKTPGKDSQLAQQLLPYLSFFAPQTPIAMAWLQPLLTAETPLMWHQAMERLLALGLVERPGPGQVQMHRLVMQFVQGEIEPETGRGLMVKVAKVMGSKAKEVNDLELPKLFEPLLVHVLWLAKTMEEAGELKAAAGLYNNLGYHYRMNGEYRLAQPAIEQALQLRQQVLAADHPAIATCLNNLGLVLNALGDYAGAKSYAERSLAIVEKELGANHPNVAASLNNLGSILQNMGDYAGAKSYTERALAIVEKELGTDHPHTASALNTLGSILQDMGDYAGAKSYIERALDIRKKELGADHPNVATSLNNLGSILQNMGDYAGAKSYAERALAIDEQVYGAHHPAVAVSLSHLVAILQALRDYAEAKVYAERALAIFERILGADHPHVAASLNNLGQILMDMGDYAGAKSYAERALAIVEKVLGADHPHVATSLNNLGQILMDMGDYTGAKSYTKRALAIFEKVLGANHPYSKMTRENLEGIVRRLKG